MVTFAPPSENVFGSGTSTTLPSDSLAGKADGLADSAAGLL